MPSFSKPDLFLNQNLSVGEATPINSDPMQTWRAGQARTWFDLPDALTSARLFVQGGLGFLRTDPFTQSYGFFATPAFMIPFGFGVDSMTNSGLRLTTMLMLDVTRIAGRMGAKKTFNHLAGEDHRMSVLTIKFGDNRPGSLGRGEQKMFL